jgi:hypothetical protein
VRAGKQLWPELRKRAQRATEAFGAKAALARELTVTPQAVSEWLSGASAPDAENTLRVLEFVQAHEAKLKSPGSAINTTRAATRRRRQNSDEPKPTPGRRKK